MITAGQLATPAADGMRQIAKRLPELEDVNFRGGILACSTPAIFQVENAGRPHDMEHLAYERHRKRKRHSRWVSAYYSPIRYSELPRYYRERRRRAWTWPYSRLRLWTRTDTFNFGPSASHLEAVCEKAKIIIVEVNEESCLYCLGTKGVHITDVAMIVEG